MDPSDANRELLGVQPGASRAEIAAAYRRRVMDLHPDRHPHLSSADRRDREQDTVQLNVAYAALLVAAERKSPDASGAWEASGGRPVAELVRDPIAVSADESPSLPPPGPPGPPDPPGPPGPSAPDRKRGRTRARVLRALAVAALVGVASLATLFVARGPATPGLAVGRCVAWSGGYTVVDCAERHDGRVSTIVARARDCPSGGFTRAHGKVFCLDVRS